MIVLDASVVIALLSNTDPHHPAALAIFNDWADAGYVVHPVTLAEILVGPARAGIANEVAAGLEATGVTTSTHADAVLLAELRVSTGLRMPDCCVLAVATSDRLPVATFDIALAREARRIGLTVAGT